MEQSFFWAIFGVIVIGFLTLMVWLNIRLRESKKGGSLELIKGDVTELNRSILKLSDALSDKLERNSNAVQSSVQKQLTESAKLVADVSERLAKLD